MSAPLSTCPNRRAAVLDGFRHLFDALSRDDQQRVAAIGRGLFCEPLGFADAEAFREAFAAMDDGRRMLVATSLMQGASAALIDPTGGFGAALLAETGALAMADGSAPPPDVLRDVALLGGCWLRLADAVAAHASARSAGRLGADELAAELERVEC